MIKVDWAYRHQPEFEGALKELVAKYRGQGATIGYAHLTSVHAAVLARKRFLRGESPRRARTSHPLVPSVGTPGEESNPDEAV
ncbi:MAG: hypothetical protein ACOX5G_04785 [Kiritimatiellia bacterium]|jgi:hypothetical protein